MRACFRPLASLRFAPHNRTHVERAFDNVARATNRTVRVRPSRWARVRNRSFEQAGPPRRGTCARWAFVAARRCSQLPRRWFRMALFNRQMLQAFLALGALLVGVARAGSAQYGTITGTVVDQAGGPVSPARVLLGATNKGAVTNQQGKYVVAGVAPGTYELRVAIIGYAGDTKKVTVGAGESVTADFTLKRVALSLDAVQVTTSGEQRARENGNSITRIDAPDIVPTQPITSMTDLLSGRAAGVNILPSTGTVGGGARIRIRGANSVSLSNDPLFI